MLHRRTEEAYARARRPARTDVASPPQGQRPAGKASGPNARAFTLIEMLIVISIIVFLSGITLMFTAPYLKGRAIRSGATAVQSMVYQARTYATTHMKQTMLTFSAADQSMSIYSPPVAVRDNRVSEPVHLPKGVFFVVVGGVVRGCSTGCPRGDIVFSPAGSLDVGEMGTGNCEIRLTRLDDLAAESEKLITVIFASGLVYIEDE